jgi:small subunit ribosomal protein S3
LRCGGVSHIDIERAATRLKIRIVIYTSRPGIIIGRKGAEIEKLLRRASWSGRPAKRSMLSIQEIKPSRAQRPASGRKDRAAA